MRDIPIQLKGYPSKVLTFGNFLSWWEKGAAVNCSFHQENDIELQIVVSY